MGLLDLPFLQVIFSMAFLLTFRIFFRHIWCVTFIIQNVIKRHGGFGVLPYMSSFYNLALFCFQFWSVTSRFRLTLSKCLGAVKLRCVVTLPVGAPLQKPTGSSTAGPSTPPWTETSLSPARVTSSLWLLGWLTPAITPAWPRTLPTSGSATRPQSPFTVRRSQYFVSLQANLTIFSPPKRTAENYHTMAPCKISSESNFSLGF